MNTIAMGGPDASAGTDGWKFKCEERIDEIYHARFKELSNEHSVCAPQPRGHQPSLSNTHYRRPSVHAACLRFIPPLLIVQLLPIFQDSAHGISFKKPFMDFPSYPRRKKFYSFGSNSTLHLMPVPCGRQRSVSITRIQSHLRNPRTKWCLLHSPSLIRFVSGDYILHCQLYLKIKYKNKT